MTAGELYSIFKSAKLDLSLNTGDDRVAVAHISYNEGKLEDGLWLSYPNFNTVMAAAPTLKLGLHELRRPFVAELLRLYGVLYLAIITSSEGYPSNMQDVNGDAAWTVVREAIESMGISTYEITDEVYSRLPLRDNSVQGTMVDIATAA